MEMVLFGVRCYEALGEYCSYKQPHLAIKYQFPLIIIMGIQMMDSRTEGKSGSDS